MGQSAQYRPVLTARLQTSRPAVNAAGRDIALVFRPQRIAQTLGVHLGPDKTATEKQALAAVWDMIAYGTGNERSCSFL